VHVVAPEPLEYVAPATQLVHTVAPDSQLKVPAPQDVQTVSELVVQAVEAYFPGAQAVQVLQTVLTVALQVEDTNDPALHWAQTCGLGDPVAQYVDVGHVIMLDAFGQYEPRGHRSDAVDPAGQ